MREPGCQRFDQFHPRDAPRRLPGPPIAGTRPSVPTLPGFLFLSSFGATQPFSSLLILFPIRSANTSNVSWLFQTFYCLCNYDYPPIHLPFLNKFKEEPLLGRLGSNQRLPYQSGRHAIRGLPQPLMQQPLIFRQSAKLLPPPCSWRTPPSASRAVPIDGHERSSWVSPPVAPSGYLACAGDFDCCSRPGAFPQTEMAI